MEVRSAAPDWRRILPTPRRLAVWATPGRPGADAARVIYRPRRARARLVSALVAHKMPAAWSSAASVPNIDRILDLAGARYAHGAAVYAREPDRWLFAVTESAGRGVVVKLGRPSDDGIRHEIEMLRALAGAGAAVRLPKIRWSGEADGWVVLATEIIARDPTGSDAGLEEALSASCALAVTPLGFVVHGDLAPWNIVDTAGGLALVDWESGRFEADPLFDLSHFVTRVGALVGRWKPETAVSHLTAPGSVGWRYLETLGIDPESAPEHVARYLRRPGRPTSSDSLGRYESAMANLVEHRVHGAGTSPP